ncbi:MAG: ATP-dependent zinc metalloprotease FtsH [Atopobiaceae bacterium]|nr:ATP-dependent zinc metalloprotease FtsH [Atopobiaceae bacterium]MCI2173588.1 ATP-dependent zinc metalloprotease FtsH [Atopobiaceae bacterium]MCI2207770.1 ATP-dependent zinc metalloprotease FtsH [Atopobiaceae bacterium]
MAYLFWSSGITGGTTQTVDTLATSDYVTAVKENRVEEVTYKTSDGSLSGTYWRDTSDRGDDSKAVQFTSYYVGSDTLADLMGQHPDTSYKIDTSSGDMWETILVSVVPTLLLIGVIIYFMSQMQGQNGQAMSFGKTKAKTTEETRPKTKFSDVAGIDEAVDEVKEVRDFLAEPERFQKMGAKIPRGVLLVGPPGTGKTLLAKAIAGEAGVPFFSISGSDFVEMFVGVGASRVRDLFKQAKAASPSIIFIDEIDAVGRQRGAGLGGGHDEREQTLNQLLVEMDGFEENEAVILVAATNRPDVLDPALLRPGRFDRQITVDRPDVGGREQILKVHAKNKPIGADIDFAKLAKLTPGFTGADLMNLMNEAALLAARRNKDEIGMDEIEEAMERVIAGPERKSRIMTEKERRIIAFHEGGHALVGHILENSDPVHKVTIIPRGQALGYTMQLPTEDHFLQTRDEMLDQIAVLLSGRTSEELFCDSITTGASNDLERATKMAREMVTRYGMSEALGTQVFGEAQHQVFLGRDYADHQDYSAETAKRIDDEVERIMREAHERARKIISEHSDRMEQMATVLLARETVEGEAVTALLDGKWDEYLAAHPDEAEAEREAEAGEVVPSAGAVDDDASSSDDRPSDDGTSSDDAPADAAPDDPTPTDPTSAD